MPEGNLTDQHAYRERVGTGARIREGSDELAGIIAAGPYHSADPLHIAAVDAERARSGVRALVPEHPRLRLVAAVLDDAVHELSEYAEAAGL